MSETNHEVNKALTDRELEIENANLKAWNYWGRKWRLGQRGDISPHVLRIMKTRALIYRKVYSKISSQLGQLSGKTILDVGCGTSDYHFWLAKDCERLVGVDISVEMLKLCRNEIGKSNIEVVAADALHLPFKDIIFDASITFQALHHFPDWRKSLTEMKRTSKRISLYEPNADSFLHKFLNLIRKAFRSEQRFKEVDEDYELVEFQASGFSEKELKSFLFENGIVTNVFLFGIVPLSLAEKIYKLSPNFLNSVLIVEDLIQKIPFIRKQLGNLLVIVQDSSFFR